MKKINSVSKFKYASVQVIFELYDCDCVYTWIQIWRNCNISYVMPDFKFWNTLIQLYCEI